MDLRLWKQAQADNPDPENYIPVPIIGFSEVSYFLTRSKVKTVMHLKAAFLIVCR